jgi:hypothetical protein
MTRERLGKFDQHYREIDGETVDGQNAYAAAVYVAGAANSSSMAVCLVASGSYSIDYTSALQTNPGKEGLYLLWDVHVIPSSGTIQAFIDIYDPCWDDYYAIWQSGANYATGTTATMRKYLIHPGAIDDQSQMTLVDRIPMPYQWRLRINVEGALTWNYSLAYQYVG